MNFPDLCVYACGSTERALAEAFARKHHLPCFSGEAFEPKRNLPEALQPFSYVLYYCAGSIAILQLGNAAPGPVSASFMGGKTGHRLKFGGGKGQMIAKAVGLNKGVTPKILDATAGLGRDAFVLASLGCQVTMLERSALIAELLRGALVEEPTVNAGSYEGGQAVQEILGRMALIECDASQWLQSKSEPVADVIYLDPMYPHREKSSLVKKEMRLFQTLVGEDLDDEELLAAALDKALYRVVVKRPRKGDAIKGKKPSLQLRGKSCRYDIYTLRRIEDLADKHI